jgi:drug/metabolite transporter (DMT)-like permease
MIGVLFYACVGFCLIKAYQYEYKSMSMISVLWSALSVISILLVGYFYWGDDINYMEIIGVILVISGSILVLYEYETEILTKNDEISLKRE